MTGGMTGSWKGHWEMEILTREVALAYREKARALPYNGAQDIGQRRALRLELQARCGVTELEAVNILNGNNIDDYCTKHLARARAEGEAVAQGAARRQKARRGRREWY